MPPLPPGDPSPWCCPICHGPLDDGGETLSCRACARVYPVFTGIPDFRLARPAWVDVDGDRLRACELAKRVRDLTPAQLVEEVFRQRGWPEAEVARRAAQIVGGPARLRRELEGWLRPAADSTLPFLDLGCGAGQLLAATPARPAIGIDVGLEWLVVAQQLIASHGGRPRLAAALAEALPLRSGSLGGVISLDVIEHVGDQVLFLREIERVLAPGATCALATPNRYSLAPEPHVNLWGVGWLPRRYQAPYVQWRSGKPYAFCRLLTPAELSRMLAASTDLRFNIVVPEIPLEEIASFGPSKARLARVYNRLVNTRLGRPVLTRVGAFFRVLAVKPA